MQIFIMANKVLDDLVINKGEIINYNSSLNYPNYTENGSYIDPKKISSISLNKNLKKTCKHALNNATLPWLLEIIESQQDPVNFKEAVLSGVQLYFDGLVERRNETPNPEIWGEQLETLNALLKGVRMTVASYYRQDRDVPFDEVREIVLPHGSKIIRHGSRDLCRTRHLAGQDLLVKEGILETIDALGGEKVDLIIPVASGGFESAVLMADYLGVDNVFPARYSIFSRNDREVLLPGNAPLNYPKQQISKKGVLIMDDIVSSGATACKMTQWAKKYNPTKVYFSVASGTSKDLRDHKLFRHNDSDYLLELEEKKSLLGRLVL